MISFELSFIYLKFELFKLNLRCTVNLFYVCKHFLI